jgi:hypothetical protein
MCKINFSVSYVLIARRPFHHKFVRTYFGKFDCECTIPVFNLQSTFLNVNLMRPPLMPSHNNSWIVCVSLPVVFRVPVTVCLSVSIFTERQMKYVGFVPWTYYLPCHAHLLQLCSLVDEQMFDTFHVPATKWIFGWSEVKTVFGTPVFRI